MGKSSSKSSWESFAHTTGKGATPLTSLAMPKEENSCSLCPVKQFILGIWLATWPCS